jgi:hypothetical protein
VTQPVEVVLIPVHGNVFHDPDPVVQQKIDQRVRETALHQFGHDRVRVEALTEPTIDGMDLSGYVLLRVTAEAMQ